MNRPLEKLIIVDDNAFAYSMQPDNAVPIKPYTDARDHSDNALEELAPFLEAIVNEGVQDVPRLLRELRPEADRRGVSIPQIYKERVERIKMAAVVERERGLHGYMRGRSEFDFIGTKKKTPGEAGGVALDGRLNVDSQGRPKKQQQGEDNQLGRRYQEKHAKGSIWQSYEASAKEKEEAQQMKIMEWNRIMMEKEQQKQQG